MHSFIGKIINYKSEIFIFLGVIFYSWVIRLASSNSYSFFSQFQRVFWVAICIAILNRLWKDGRKSEVNFSFSRWYILSYLLFSFLYVLTALIKRADGIILPGVEILSAFLVGSTLFCLIVFLLYLFYQIPVRSLRILCQVFGYVVLGISIFLPAEFLGYYLVSGHVLTADILLTLFQTNGSETAAYLKSQNLLLWGAVSFLIVFALAAGIALFRKVMQNRVTIKKKWILLLAILVILFGGYELPRQKNFYMYSVCSAAKKELANFKKYGETREKRLKMLAAMPELKRKYGGIYVLVIGESATRDHMGTFGYDRDTTPWLSSQLKNESTVGFTHGYANFTHTVPALTFALTEKNQYNHSQIALENVPSFIEIAISSGYETYWLSNQRKYSVWDTPIAEIASTAENQVWINEEAGTGNLQTMYYDGDLLNHLPDLNGDALIVFHLMGSHGIYLDRYPESYARFKGKGKVVDAYDNSILYTDAVLKQIYERISSYPNFQAMCYISDHGDDPDRNVGHEATKFTWEMSHIPFVLWTSQNFRDTRPEVWETLKNHREDYWSNDLLYELMTSLMGIEGAPGMDAKMDISSPDYDRTRDNLLTMHGKRKVTDDSAAG